MTQTRIRNGVAPLLGGFAIALLVLGTMVASVQALTVCEQCTNSAWARALAGECKHLVGQATFECLAKAVSRECYNEEKPVCPNTSQVPGTVTCVSYLPEGTECSNGAKGNCNNATWNLNCDAADSSKHCLDTQVLPASVLSLCNVTCSCR